MDIQFRKGTVEYLDGCIKAMENSSMCTAYFQSEESRKNAVMEGINRGTLYVVLCSGECAGFAYFIDYNPDAKIFYEKLGYKYLGTIPSLYRKGIDEFLMMKVYEEGE
ncbi:MAG: hypothetical protein KZY87_19835 [Lachnospiraceae bacterium]|nr:hypothetical protein [Lachnospiraceae bacterium]